MADTTWIKNVLEPYVRGWLAKQFVGCTFSEKPVTFPHGGSLRFDAVASDDSVFAAILANRPKTKTGRENTGGVRKALAELQGLARVSDGVTKVAVFTDGGFRELMRRRAGSKMGKDLEAISMMVCELPQDIRLQLNHILDAASAEQRSRVV